MAWSVLVPPVSAVIAYLMFGETLTPVQTAGMAVAAAGVGLANGPQERATR